MPPVAVYTAAVLENTGEPSQSQVWLLTSLIFDPVDGAGVQMLTCQPSLCCRHCVLVAWYLPGCASGYTDWAVPVENPSTGMVCS